MERNMKNWMKEQLNSKTKKALPVLTFPAVQLMGINVSQLISDSGLQVRALKLIAEREDTAAAVSFMDLSVEAECFGSTISFSASEVPTVVGSIVNCQEDADALNIPAVGCGRTQLYMDCMKEAVVQITDRPVFAGAIGPFSLAGRLMNVQEAMIYCYEEPEMVHTVMRKVTPFLIEYCKAYKELGANGVLMAEPLTGLLSPNLAEEFSSPYVKEIVDAVQDDHFIVIYHNCGNNTIEQVETILSVGAAAYHFGDAIQMEKMLSKLPSDVIALGNVSPSQVFLGGTPETVREATLQILTKCGGYSNFIISSGCDIPPITSWDNIDAFFAAVAEFYRQ